jgi:uncharacterized protein YoxC
MIHTQEELAKKVLAKNFLKETIRGKRAKLNILQKEVDTLSTELSAEERQVYMLNIEITSYKKHNEN